MKRNDKILQEFFFKKSTYADKLKKKYKQYQPQDKKSVDQPGFGGIIDPDTRAITDPQEAKKRLIGTFGAAIGSNSVRNVASRSIKSFPIVISDNVEPETSVMLKKLLEEQYAEYINLLVSNQVIDISEYESNDDGNIALQALDKISGHDFSKKSTARSAVRGEVGAVDFFKNSSAYNLIRQENKEYKTGVPMFDALLEDAVILNKEDASTLIEFIQSYPDDIAILNEAPTLRDENRTSSTLRDTGKSSETDRPYVKLDDFLTDNNQGKLGKTNSSSKISKAAGNKYANTNVMDKYKKDIKDQQNKLITLERKAKDNPSDKSKKDEVTKAKNELKYLVGLKPKYDRLTSTDIVVDREELKMALDTTVGELLTDSKNAIIKDKYQKATFLLQSNRIAGHEYIEYVVIRLGLPLSKSTRANLVTEFRIQNVIDPNATNLTLNKDDIKLIANNEKIIGKILPSITSVILQDALKFAAVGAAAVGGVGVATGMITVPTLLMGPLGIAILGAAVGGGILYARIAKLWKEKRKRKSTKILGWERVESLIENIENNQINLIKKVTAREEEANKSEDKYAKKFRSYGEKVKDKELLSSSEVQQLLTKVNKNFEKYLDVPANTRNRNESMVVSSSDPILTEGNVEYLQELDDLISEEMETNREYQAEVLSEAIIQTKIPVELTTTYEYNTKAKSKVRVAPKFGAAATYAYGSVEYDKKELKERKYNAPLMLTITFKERYADGTYADNELVAVIGILGVITRVPSEEMAYILKSNAEGKTLKGILQSAGSDKNLVSDLLGATKLKKDIQNLPQSADVWQNLEKVGRLALSNKLAGKRNHNIANAHLVFSQKEVDDVRADTGTDYLRDKKLSASLMKRYSAMSIMVANDASERLYMYDDPSNISWDIVPYAALKGKDTGDQLTSALMKIGRM